MTHRPEHDNLYKSAQWIARQKILTEANKHRNMGKPWTARHIQRAVAFVRHWQLVDENTLIIAGFNPKKRRIR